MTEHRDPHGADAMVGPHGQPTDHGADGGHDDHGHADPGHGGEGLGPLDSRAWGAGILGIILGLAVAAAFLAGAA